MVPKIVVVQIAVTLIAEQHAQVMMIKSGCDVNLVVVAMVVETVLKSKQ